MKLSIIVLTVLALIAVQYVKATIDTDKNQDQDGNQQSNSNNQADADNDAAATSNQQSTSDTKSSPNQLPDMPDNNEVLKTVHVNDLIVNSDRKKCGCCPAPCCCKCAQRTVTKRTEIEGTTAAPEITTPFIPACNNTLDLVFVMDASGSIAPDNWVKSKDFVRNIIDKFHIGRKDTRIGMITYSTTVQVHWDLADPKSYSKNIDSLVASLVQERELTNTVGALQKAIEVFQTSDRSGVPNVVIAMTDGRPNFMLSIRLDVIRQLQALANVISIGVTKSVIQEQLEEMATGGNVFMVDQFDDLQQILQDLVNTVCEEAPSRAPPTTPPPVVHVEKFIEEQCTCCCPQPHLYMFGGQGSSEGTCS